jgi:tetratricopeptide (TPR) repeat protein
MAALFRQLIDRLAGTRSPAQRASDAAQWRSRGNAALAEGQLDEATQCYRHATTADPADPLARLNLGFALLEAGDAVGAEVCLMQSIALRRPGDDFLHEAHYLLGRAAALQNMTEKALSHYQAAVAAQPQFIEAMAALARTLLALGRRDEALAWARRLASAAPSPAALLLGAQALHGMGRHSEALQALDAVLETQPDDVEALELRGHVLFELGRAGEAVAVFDRALSLKGPSADTLSSVAAALGRAGQLEQALHRTEQALRLQPGHRNALFNQGRTLIELLRVGEAAEISSRALALYPQDAELRWNHANAQLLQGELQAGWPDHEARWEITAAAGGKPRPDFGRPRWSGRESLEGRTIFLFMEQGLGDCIQFLRYVPLVAATAQAVLLQLPAALVPLASGLPPNCSLVGEGEALPPFDFECALMSLPLAFGSSLDTLPRAVPYLHADPAQVQAWRRRLGQAGPDRLRVGLAWSGNPDHRNDHNRSIPLAILRRLAVAGCQFVSLQPEVRASDAGALAEWPALVQVADALRDFGDTAALMSALDLVISVDTSVAHLAGALAVPAWLLLPYCPDWRWMLDREDSPWYPTARLFRQQRPGDWSPVLDRVRADLGSLAAPAEAE